MESPDRSGMGSRYRHRLGSVVSHVGVLAICVALAACRSSTGSSDDAATTDVVASDQVAADTAPPPSDAGPEAAAEDGGGEDASDAGVALISESESIDQSGGNLDTEEVDIAVPSGALTSEQNIAVDEQMPGTVSGLPASASAYRFGPDGISFTQPIEVSFNVPAGMSDPVVYWERADRSGFDVIPSQRVGDHLVARVSHFSIGGVSERMTMTGTTLCSGVAVNTSSDVNHCGGCGRRCPSDMTCETGFCMGVQRGTTQQASCPNPSESGCGLVQVAGGEMRFTPDMGARQEMRGMRSVSTQLDGTLIVPAFAMDATEVTVARFRRFWNARPPSPTAMVPYPNGRSFYFTRPSYYANDMAPDYIANAWEDARGPREDAACAGSNWTATAGTAEAENHPMNCVDWYTMQAFCIWDGGRLPTETEWEFAALGPTQDGRPYPRNWTWGTTPPAYATCNATTADGGANLSPSCRPTAEQTLFPNKRTTRVRTYAATGGFYDLSGNVEEWTADVFGFNYLGANPMPAPPANMPACALDDAYSAPPGVAAKYLCLIENYASSQTRGRSFDTGIAAGSTTPRLDSLRGRPEAVRTDAYAAVGARCARGPVSACGGATQACCTTAGQPPCSQGLVCRAAGTRSQCTSLPATPPTPRSCQGAFPPASCSAGVVAIPGGTFTMGGDPQVLSSVGATSGGQQITVSPMLVDGAQVTVGRFRAFWTGTPRNPQPPPTPSGPAVPTRTVVFPNGAVLAAPTFRYLGEPTARTATNDCNWTPTAMTGTDSRENQPLNCVSWESAMAFCMWDSPNGRLPTEAEWEYLARGRAASTPTQLLPGRNYPWGNADIGTGQCDIANLLGYWYQCSPSGGPMGTGTTPWDRFQPYGSIRDLNANVSEWVADRAAELYGLTGRDPIDSPVWGPAGMYRGASWAEPMASLERRSVYRPAGSAMGRLNSGRYNIGFRCVH